MRTLNYRGDTREGAVPGTPLGPNLLGETLWVTGAAYDPEANRTRVTLSFVDPAGAL